MNIKKLHILAFLTVLSICCLSGCSEQEEWLAPDIQEAGTFQFSAQGVQTRLDYNFEETTFTNEELIGCVIAEVNSDGTYTYLRNSAWQYRASDGMLIFQYYWGWKMETNQWGGQSAIEGEIYPTDTEISGQYDQTQIPKIITIDDSKDDKSYLTSPYLTENTGKKLQFFFYYPYIDRELLQNEYARIAALTDENKYKAIVYPNCANATNVPSESGLWAWASITLTGEVADTENSSNGQYNWREFPCFVNHTQGDVKAEGKINDSRLQNSDFLWATSPEIMADTQGTKTLHFKKKTATILVYSEKQLNDIYFAPCEAQKLLRGKKIDLATGFLTDYTPPKDQWSGTSLERNMYFTFTPKTDWQEQSEEHIIPCYRGQNEEEGINYHFYRLVLPAQKDCRFKMHLTFDDGANNIDKDINLSDDEGLTELKEGHLYTIRIAKDGSTTLKINDWMPEEGGELEEVTTQP